MDLNIHLDGRDSIMSTGNLKVHVTEEIFEALDIGKYKIIIIGITGNKTTGNTCNHILQRNTCCHQGHAGSTGRCHRGRTVGLKGLRNGTNCIRELFLGRKYRKQCTLSKSTMTNFTTSRSTARLGLTYRVGREIILMDITLLSYVRIKSINLLNLGKRCKGYNVADLSLSTSEHGRTMNSGNEINLSRQRTNLVDCTTIRTLVILEDHLTYRLLLVLIYSLTKNSHPLFVISKSFSHPLGNLLDVLFTNLFLIREYSLFHLFRSNNLLHCIEEFLRDSTRLIGLLGLTNFSNHLINQSDDGLVNIMSGIDSFDHLIIRDQVTSALDHDDLITGRCNSKLHIAFIPILHGRVDDELAISHTNLSHSTRAIERNIRDTGCHSGTDHSYKLRTALRVYGHYHIIKGYVISIILGEKRTHRTIDNTCGKHGIIGSLTFSLLETTGHSADGVELLFIFNRQREEVDTFSRLVRSCCSTKQRGVTILNKNCAVCLCCDLTNLNLKRSSGKVHFECLNHIHLLT